MTAKITCGDVDGLKAAAWAGVNTAVSKCDPANNFDVVPDAVPLLTLTGVPSPRLPSLNCTVPSAVAGVTAAVNVTGALWATGEAGVVVNLVEVAVFVSGEGGAELWWCRGSPSASVGAALAGPPMTNNAPRTAAVTGTAPTVYR